MNVRIAFVAAVALVAATPALAQDSDAAGTQGSAGGHIAIVTGFDGTKVSAAGASDKLDGVAYGVKLGYDFSVMEHGLLGVEAEYTQSTAKFDAGGGDTLKMSRDFYIGGRVKFDVSDTVALYLKGGYTNAGLKATSGGATERTNIDGWRIGAGAEFKIAGPLVGLVEYRYSNYGSYDIGIGVPAKVERHQAIAGLGYKF